MATIKLMIPNGKIIHNKTLVNGRLFQEFTNKDVCFLMRNIWRKETESKSFQNWADSLNESGEYDSEFTADDALDNLCNLFHLEIDGKAINVFDFYTTNRN